MVMSFTVANELSFGRDSITHAAVVVKVVVDFSGGLPCLVKHCN